MARLPSATDDLKRSALPFPLRNYSLMNKSASGPATSRRSFLTRAAGAAVAAVLPSSRSAKARRSCGLRKQGPLNNILFVMSDDMRTELGCYASRFHAHTPTSTNLLPGFVALRSATIVNSPLLQSFALVALHRLKLASCHQGARQPRQRRPVASGVDHPSASLSRERLLHAAQRQAIPRRP